MLIGRNRRIGRYMRFADWFARTTSIVLGALNKANIDQWTLFSPALRTIFKHVATGWPVPLMLIAAPLVAWLRRKTDKSRLDAVHDLLNTIRDHVFHKDDFDHEQHRRVTLFKHRQYCFRRWPWNQGWLIPIERSGTLTRKTTAIFSAPDDGELGEGVAGRAWSKKSMVYVSDLPDLRGQPTDQDFKDYAAKSFMKADDLKKKPPQARSLCGLHVEVDGKPWGVLVIDSVNAGFSKKSVDSVFLLFNKALSRYLKGL